MRRSERGSLLAFTLMVITLALLTAGAFLIAGRRAGFSAFQGHASVQNEALAKAAVNRLIHQLQFDQAFSSDLQWRSADGTLSYNITFDSSQPFYSVNNVGGGNAQVSSTTGQAVPQGNLEALVTVRTGTLAATYRYVLGRGIGTLVAMGSNGGIDFGGDVTLQSITDLSDPTPSRFSVVSNSTTTGVTYSVAPGTFTVPSEAKMRSSSTIAPAIQSQFGSTSDWQENAPRQPLPQVAVTQLVQQENTHPAPVLNPQGTLMVQGDRFASNLNVNGSIDLADGSLYVDGDLVVNGGITGFGSVFVSGDVTMRGGSATISTNARNGAAVYAGGDITFTGLSATDYLNSLAGANPQVASAWSDFQEGYNYIAQLADHPNPGGYTTSIDPTYESVMESSNVTGDFATYFSPTLVTGQMLNTYPFSRDLFLLKMKMGPGADGDNPEPLPRPGPGGHQSPWHDDSHSRGVRDALQSLPGAGSGTDPRLDHLIQAFEEIGFTFRHDWNNGASPEWDHPFGPYQADEISFDQVIWLIAGYDGRNFVNTELMANAPFPAPNFTSAQNIFYNNQDAGRDNFRTLFHHHPPLDFSWLGKGYFQGVLYADGNITLENDATVIGLILSGGNLNLTDGTEFTYNKEYEDLFQRQTGPIRVKSFSKL